MLFQLPVNGRTLKKSSGMRVILKLVQVLQKIIECLIGLKDIGLDVPYAFTFFF